MVGNFDLRCVCRVNLYFRDSISILSVVKEAVDMQCQRSAGVGRDGSYLQGY